MVQQFPINPEFCGFQVIVRPLSLDAIRLHPTVFRDCWGYDQR
jgi:hypothetical protein